MWERTLHWDKGVSVLLSFSQTNSASKRKVQIHDPRPLKPELALVYIEYLLTHPKNRECLLSAPRKKLSHLLRALGMSKVTYRTDTDL